MGDGQGFVKAFLSFMASRVSESEDGTVLQYPLVSSNPIRPWLLTRLFLNLLGIWMTFWTALRYLLFKRKTLIKSTITVAKQVGWTNDISLDDVKMIKNRLGVTVNDVLVGATSVAIERFLEERAALRDSRLWYIIPKSLRRPSDVTISNQTGFCKIIIYFLESNSNIYL
jgi:hypothetical protein